MDEPLAKRTKPDYWSPDFLSLLNVNSKLPDELDTGMSATDQVYGDESQTSMTSQQINSLTQLPSPGPASTEQFEWMLINDDLVLTNPSNSMQVATVNSQQQQQPVQQPVQLPMHQLEQPVQILHQPMQLKGQPVQQLVHPVQQLGHPVQQLGHPVQQLGQPVQQLGQPVHQLEPPAQSTDGLVMRRIISPMNGMLLHAHKCMRREQQNQQPPCGLPHCATAKNALKHMANCHQGKSCKVPHCVNFRLIITHWAACTRTDCYLCLPEVRNLRDKRRQATPQASTALTSLVSAAVSQAAKLNAAYSASGLKNLFQLMYPESNQQNASSMVTNNGQLWTSEGQADRFQQDGRVSHQGPHAGAYLGIEHRSATAEEWRQSITQDSRNHLVQKLVQAVFTPNPEQLHDPRIDQLIQYSRKLEGDLYEQASSLEEYQNEMAEKICKMQKECQEKKMSLSQESDEHRSLRGLVPRVPQQNHNSLLSVGAESSLSSSCTNNTSAVSNLRPSIGASSNSSMSPLQTFYACDVTVKQENNVKIKEEIVDNDDPSWGLQQSFESFKSEAVKMEDVKSVFENSSPELVSVVEKSFEASRSSFDMEVVHGMNLKGKGVKETFQQTKLNNKIVDEFKALSPVQANEIEKKTVEQLESIVEQYELLIREQDDQLHTVRLELSELKSKMADTQSNLEEAYKQMQLLKDQNALLKTHIEEEEDCRVKDCDLKRAPPQKVKKVPTTGITWTTISACKCNRRMKKLSSTKADANRPNRLHTRLYRVALLTKKAKQLTVSHKFVERNNLSIRISELENKNSKLQAEIMDQNQKMENILDENSSLSSRFEEHDNLTLLNGELNSIRKSARKQLKQLGEKLEIEDDDDDDNDMVDNVLPLHEFIELDALKMDRDYIPLVLFAEEYSRIKSYWKRLKELTEQLENEDDVDDDDDMDGDVDDLIRERVTFDRMSIMNLEVLEEITNSI